MPSTLEEMITLPGVGRKTANLVMILAFKSHENICVDIHVHRIANRLGWVRTRTPEETEQALYKAIDRQWWPVVNLYLVTWGQNMCRPVYPRCGDCALHQGVRRVDVTRSRQRQVDVMRRTFLLARDRCRRSAPSLPRQGKTSPGAGPSIVVVETEKGTFEFETYPNEAPKTVAHILGADQQALLQRPARASRRARAS